VKLLAKIFVALILLALSAGKGMGTGQLQEAWLESHSLLAQRYSNCRRVVALYSDHHVQVDNSDFVASQILSIAGELNS
jgi:hypothetical protein